MYMMLPPRFIVLLRTLAKTFMHGSSESAVSQQHYMIITLFTPTTSSL